jgi:hypothetical protein
VSTGTEVGQVGQWTPRRALRLLGLALCCAAAVAAVALLGGKESESAAGHAEPALLEQADGARVRRVVLTQHAAERTGIETAAARTSAASTVVPYSALIYDAHGATWVYTRTEPLGFVRTPVAVQRIDGAFAYLSDGPPSGAEVVTVGGAEIYGVEAEIGH